MHVDKVLVILRSAIDELRNEALLFEERCAELELLFESVEEGHQERESAPLAMKEVTS